MKRLLSDQSLSNNNRALLHFSLATVMDRRGLYSQAAAHRRSRQLSAIRRQVRRAPILIPDQHARFIDQIIACFNPDFLARGTGWGSSDPRPIFVIGFPRSGTTLLEQILASHPRIHSGELSDLQRIFKALPQPGRPPLQRPVQEALSLLGPAATQAAAQALPRTPGRPGRRDGRSCRRQDAGEPLPPRPDRPLIPPGEDRHFLAEILATSRSLAGRPVSASAWNNDWDHNRAATGRLSAHGLSSTWKEVRPIPWLEIPYEDVVADLEHHARLLIDFVGLEWHPACLEFYSNRHVVRTPSHAQVRQPIHSRSVARWRHYEQSLQPLLPSLRAPWSRLEDVRLIVLASRVEGEGPWLIISSLGLTKAKTPVIRREFCSTKAG